MAMPDFSQEDIEVRCPGGLLGITKGEGLIEVKCRHWACTRGSNVTYHLIDTHTGDIVETYRFQDPNKE